MALSSSFHQLTAMHDHAKKNGSSSGCWRESCGFYCSYLAASGGAHCLRGGLGRNMVHTPQGDQLPSKSQLAMIYTEAHRLGNCSKQNKQTSLWIYGPTKGPLTTEEMCFPALFYHQIPTKGLNAYVKPTEHRIWAGFKLLHPPCYPSKLSHSSSPIHLSAAHWHECAHNGRGV